MPKDSQTASVRSDAASQKRVDLGPHVQGRKIHTDQKDSHVCPCCGGKFDGIPVEAMAALTPGHGAKIVRYVARRPGATGEQIADHLYADDPDGGPDTAASVITATICRCNAHWRQLGWVVRGTQKVGGYYLRRVE